MDEEEAQLRAIRQGEIDRCKAAIDGELGSQQDAAAYADIIAAKKEAVGLQLEAAYRARLVEAHQQVSYFYFTIWPVRSLELRAMALLLQVN